MSSVFAIASKTSSTAYQSPAVNGLNACTIVIPGASAGFTRTWRRKGSAWTGPTNAPSAARNGVHQKSPAAVGFKNMNEAACTPRGSTRIRYGCSYRCKCQVFASLAHRTRTWKTGRSRNSLGNFMQNWSPRRRHLRRGSSEYRHEQGLSIRSQRLRTEWRAIQTRMQTICNAYNLVKSHMQPTFPAFVRLMVHGRLGVNVARPKDLHKRSAEKHSFLAASPKPTSAASVPCR
jgi:hypothetical protein